MKNDVRFSIGCDYTTIDQPGIIKYSKDGDYKTKVYCAFCGEEAIVERSYHDRDDYEDYYCNCEGSKLFAYIEKLKCDLSKFTRDVEKKFKILDLLKEEEKLNNRYKEIEEEIKKLEK